MIEEREQIKQALLRIGLGQEVVGGRERASRVSALRRAEMMTRPAEQPEAEPIRTRLDYPVAPCGKFDPSADPSWWPIDMAWMWEAGSERERAAIEEWDQWGGRQRWELEGRPWSRSAWERDPTPWTHALR